MKEVLLIGHLALNTNHIGGQTIKSRNVYEALKKENIKVTVFDTYELKSRKYLIITLLWKIIFFNKILLIPAQNNLLILSPYIFIWKKILNKNVTLIAVGGWLCEFVKKYKFHKYILRKLGPILVQNESLAKRLATEYYFDNVSTLHNFKVYSHTPTINRYNGKLKIVYLGRIIPEKGTDLIFEICHKIQNENDNSDLEIHFIGPIRENYKSLFLNKVSEFSFVEYMGSIHPENLYSLLDEYDVMLFPTKYEGEGFPGVILDALNLGIPVISTKWKDIPTVIEDGENGYLVEVDDKEMIYSILNKIRNDDNLLFKLKQNAFQSSKNYSAELGVEILKKHIGLS